MYLIDEIKLSIKSVVSAKKVIQLASLHFNPQISLILKSEKKEERRKNEDDINFKHKPCKHMFAEYLKNWDKARSLSGAQ